MESDLDFCERLAAMDNCEFGVEDGRGFLVQRRNGAGTVALVRVARERASPSSRG